MMRDESYSMRCLVAAALASVFGAAIFSSLQAYAASPAPPTLAQVHAECLPSKPFDEGEDGFIQSLLPGLSEKTDDDLRLGVAELTQAESDPVSDLILCMVKLELASRAGGAPAVAGGDAGKPASPSAAGDVKGKPKQLHVEGAVATSCLKPLDEGGVQNQCNFAIEYVYCVYKPKKDSWSSAFDCEQGKTGSWQVGPLSKAIMQNNGERLVYFGCKYGATLAKPDGISPADFRFVTPENSVARCTEWGAK